eukprot:6537020-Lingulodinium_polyedra.AAC.1
MMRLNRPAAATTARKPHASRTPREHQFLVFAWCARNVRFARRCGGRRNRCGGRRSIRPHQRVPFAKRYNDAIEPTTCRHNDSQIALVAHTMRTPKTG